MKLRTIKTTTATHLEQPTSQPENNRSKALQQQQAPSVISVPPYAQDNTTLAHNKQPGKKTSFYDLTSPAYSDMRAKFLTQSRQ